MKPVVAINEPCHESWEKMNPEEQGRFCDQCCKVVVDFTKMSNTGIADYLKKHSEQKTCGRFRTEQVASLPKKNFRFSFNIKRFAAAVLLAFGSFLFTSCQPKPHDHEVMGDVAYIPDTIVKHEVAVDTLQKNMLEVQLQQPTPTECGNPNEEPMIMGGVSYIPDEKE